MSDFTKGYIVGIAVACGTILGMHAAEAGVDTHHPAHERAEVFVCEHPLHAKRAHGLTIMPEACE